MSDDDKNGNWNANYGFTLPDGNNVAYNITLSPLFMNRAGQSQDILSTVERGIYGYLWSKNSIALWANEALRLAYHAVYVWPSTGNTRAYIHSLRCLVSTTNS